MIKLIVISVIWLVVCSAGAFACYSVGKYFEDKEIESFDECVSFGGVVSGENPKVCTDGDGNRFIEEVSGN